MALDGEVLEKRRRGSPVGMLNGVAIGSMKGFRNADGGSPGAD
jgi:hypothetical protein